MRGRLPALAVEAEVEQRLAAALVGLGEQRAPVEVQDVEDHVGHRLALGQAPHRRLGRQVHAPLQALEAGAALLVEGHDLAVEQRVARAERAPEPAQLRVAGRDVVEVARDQPRAPALDVAERPHPVPLDLVGPAVVARRQRPRLGEHGHQALRQRLALRVLRRVHPVDHPVGAVRAEQHVAPLHALAVEGHHDLRVAELVQLVGPAVPHLHRPGAVLALGDRALELEVLERVVLRAHREVVALGVGRDALRHRPGGERALVLEAQVPVQRARVVLLDDEPWRVRGRSGCGRFAVRSSQAPPSRRRHPAQA